MDKARKKQKRLSLREKLILGGVISVFIPFFIAGTIIYFQLSNSLLNLSREKALHIAEDSSASIDEMLTQEIKFVSSIAADPAIVKASKTGDYHVAQIKLETIYKRIGKKYFTIFIADREGIARADAFFKEQIGLDLSDRDYFIKAKAGDASVTGPMKARGAATFGSPIILVCAPIQDKNEFYGIAAIPFSDDLLVNNISQHNIGQTGYAYLINDEGLILAHPRKEFILNLALFNQPGTEEIRNLVAGKKDGIANYSFEGSEKIAGLSRMKLTGWTAAFTQNKDEIMSPVNDIIYSIFISGIIFLAITVLIIILFSKNFSRPIQKMMEMRKQVTHHSTEIILEIGLDKKIRFANPAFERVTGLNAETIIGTEACLNNLNNLAPTVIWDALESGKSWSGRVMIRGNRSDSITLDVMLVPLRDDRGTIHGYLQIGRDITAELMFEKRLQQAQKLEAIGTLAGGIAHDFNNILGAIFGYAELALMKTDSVEDTKRYIKQIKIASERARDLVSQILTFSRKTDIELRPLMPKLVLKEAIKLLRASIPAKIDIKSKFVSDSVIKAEPTQLHQIVMNLFTNAVHAMGDQAGTITLELEDFIVAEEFTKTHPNIQRGKHVKIRVSDSGSGINPEILDKIFEPFFTTKSLGQGTGLGLSVVHGIVKKLGGIITAYSEPGKGTVFNIIIPCVENEGVKWDQQESSLREGSERIFIIDDESSIASPLQAILENTGYQVTAFMDSTEALRTIELNPNDVDIIVSDYSMPQLSGLEIAQALRAAGINIPIILTSGFFEKTIEDAARSLGITEFITKPISSYQITDAIGRIMDQQD